MGEDTRSLREWPASPDGRQRIQVAVFSKARVNDVNWALRRREPGFKWGLGSDPEDQDLSVVLATPGVDLATALDDVVGADAWRWRREVPGD